MKAELMFDNIGGGGGGGMTTIDSLTTYSTPNTFTFSVPSGVSQIVLVITSYYAGTNVSITGGTVDAEEYSTAATTGQAALHCLLITPTASTITADITSQDAYSRGGYITVVY